MDKIILMDDREKKPWKLDFQIIKKRLDFGDYTIKGYENLVRIEKKENWEEIVGNMSSKVNRLNFFKTCKRMQKFPVRFIFVNDDIRRIPHVRIFSEYVTPRNLLNWVLCFQLQYGIPVVPIGSGKTSTYYVNQFFRKVFQCIEDKTLFTYTEKGSGISKRLLNLLCKKGETNG